MCACKIELAFAYERYVFTREIANENNILGIDA